MFLLIPASPARASRLTPFSVRSSRITAPRAFCDFGFWRGRGITIDLEAVATLDLKHKQPWLAGIEEDLEAGLRPPDTEAAIEEANAFGRLLVALHRGEIEVPDEAARSALGRAAEGFDEASGYERVIAVDDAHHALLSLLA
jgi:hypothetical protein